MESRSWNITQLQIDKVLRQFNTTPTKDRQLMPSWYGQYKTHSIYFKNNACGTLRCPKWTFGASVLAEVPVGPDVAGA